MLWAINKECKQHVCKITASAVQIYKTNQNEWKVQKAKCTNMHTQLHGTANKWEGAIKQEIEMRSAKRNDKYSNSGHELTQLRLNSQRWWMHFISMINCYCIFWHVHDCSVAKGTGEGTKLYEIGNSPMCYKVTLMNKSICTCIRV